MARAEIAAERAAVLAISDAQRNASQVGAYAERDQPIRLPCLVRSASVCGSRSSDSGTALASADLFGRQVADEHRLLAPDDLDRLARPRPSRCRPRLSPARGRPPTATFGRSTGRSAATAPTPAKLTAATFRKSRRRTPPPVSAVLSDTPADCALVAIIPLLTRMAGACRKVRQRSRSSRAPVRLAGLIATGSGDVKGPISLFTKHNFVNCPGRNLPACPQAAR